MAPLLRPLAAAACCAAALACAAAPAAAAAAAAPTSTGRDELLLLGGDAALSGRPEVEARLAERPLRAGRFSHGPEEYKHPKAAVFRLFGNLDDIFDQIWNATVPREMQLGDERRWVSHHMIAMRDGAKLSTIVIRPTLKDGERRPALLSRSPYGPTSDEIAALFTASNGYVAVIQDQRGTFLSQGKFSMWQNDGADGTDTMAWIAAQPWSDGSVFSAGISADGCGAFTQMIEAPKQLRGQFLMLASANAHETIFPGGAFRQGLVEGWMTSMSIFTRGKSLTHTLPDIMRHEALSSWYDTVEIDAYLKQVAWPTVHLTAWWDIFVGHQMRAFDGLRAESHPDVRDEHVIFVGPYGHCELGNLLSRPHVSYNEAKAWVNSFGYAMELFRGEHGPFRQKARRVNFFVQGLYEPDGLKVDAGNFWASMDEWPAANPTKLYFSRHHRLTSQFPLFGAEQVQAGDDEYSYSPANPASTTGGNNLILILLGHKCGPQDQSHIERRKDVVVFTTSTPLAAPVAITGRITAELYVSSNRKDTDFTVSLTDVYPDGWHSKSIQVRYGIQRMRWRDGPTKQSAPMEADQVYKITVDLWPTSWVFNAGHRIRVSVSSSNAPYYMRNDNLDDELLHRRPEYANERARNTVHFSSEYPSHITLPIVDLEELREHRSSF